MAARALSSTSSVISSARGLGLGCGLGFALTSAALIGCSSTPTPAAIEASSAATPSQPTAIPETSPMRVLVTGFNDWKDLGEPANVWRCRDNPSCRLLVGDPQTEAPVGLEGPLVERLRAAAPAIEWQFATLPVTWEVFSAVPDDVDVIINIGLGIYDRVDALQLEAGAYNLRRGTDAAGREHGEAIDAGRDQVLEPPPRSPIPARIEALGGQTIAGYEILVAEAREANSYLCNETHFRALSAVHSSGGRLREAYFLHIPYASEGDYDALAEGVAGVVLGLVNDETPGA